MRSSIAIAAALALVLVATGCVEEKPLPLKALRADKSITGTSRFPAAIDPKKVGKYPAAAKLGGGYFYDDVLEYRVWLSPHEDAEPLAGGSDYLFAFAEYESALAFSQATRGAEVPLVLIRQREWINEKKPGQYEVKKGERIAEWSVEWLEGSKRKPNSIAEFLAHPRKPRTAPPGG
jgi:hypothetical protein